MKTLLALFLFTLSLAAQTREAARCADSSTVANTITCATPDGFPGSYQKFQQVLLIPANTNTGPATLNINGLGAKSLTKNGSTALAAGDLATGTLYTAVYDGTQFQVQLGGSATSGSGPANAVTSAAPIPADAIVLGQDGARGVQPSPASVDAAGNASFPGNVASGQGSGKTGSVEMTAITSGNTAGFSVPDLLGTSILYLLPALPGSPGQSLIDTGVATCPTNASGSPTICHQLGWGAGGSSSGPSGTFFPGGVTGNFAPLYGATLPPTTGWTIDNPSSGTVLDVSNGYLYFNAAATGCVCVRGIYRAAPTAPYSETFLIEHDYSGGITPGPEMGTMIGFRKSSTGQIAALFTGYGWGGAPALAVSYYNTSSSLNSNPVGTHGSPATNDLIARNPSCFKIVDDGVNLSFYQSLDCTSTSPRFTQLFQLSRTAFMAGGPDQIFIGAYVNSGPVQQIVYSMTQGIN